MDSGHILRGNSTEGDNGRKDEREERKRKASDQGRSDPFEKPRYFKNVHQSSVWNNLRVLLGCIFLSSVPRNLKTQIP